MSGPVYLDANASAPLCPRVLEVANAVWADPRIGNPASTGHAHGSRAARLLHEARAAIASVVGDPAENVVFTSGATEANNLALFGVAKRQGPRHMVVSALEHKSVREPVRALARSGWEVNWIAPDPSGVVDRDAFLGAIRDDTALVAMMHVHNELGTIQPVAAIAEALGAHSAHFHVDAAQGFARDDQLEHQRIDSIAVSGHKLHAPPGVGALIARRSADKLAPLFFGGGQEGGLRPGTVPVALAYALGVAAERAHTDRLERRQACWAMRRQVLAMVRAAGATLHGPQPQTLDDCEGRVMPHVLHGRFEGLDAELVQDAVSDIASIATGAACDSGASLSPSLEAIGLSPDAMQASWRLSWCHFTPAPDASAFVAKVRALRERWADAA